MLRKTRLRIANAVIALVALAGGVGITNWLIPDAFQANPSSSSTPTGKQDMTVQGDAVNYRYGTIQLEVVRKSQKITAVNLIQAGANGGREQAFPTLVQAALDSQGSGFGNLSGATYTTQAFKQALDSAISKLN